MVNNSAELDAVFGALSDATRRAMLARLAAGPATVGELGMPFGITKGAVSKHVKVLERSGLLARDVQGRVHRCQLDPAPLGQAARWVEDVRAHWEARFDALADYLEELQADAAPAPATKQEGPHE
ncbi:MAG: metalloregulator ArsR/SmtB family transcription factor [Acidobacteriota bacterium]